MSHRVMSLPSAVAIGSESDSRSLGRLTRDMKKMREDAWTEFHHRYFARLFSYATALHRGDRATAEDSVQAAFLRVVRNIRRFDDEEAFWSWLTLLLRCAAADQGRKSSARQRLYETLLDDLQSGVKSAPERQGSRLVILEEAMNELKEEEQTLLREKYIDGDSTESIARRLNATKKAVECKLRRLRRKLQSRIHVLQKQSKLES